MPLTSRQRAYLRGLANPLPAQCHIGKDGVTPAVIAQLEQMLQTRELIKCALLRHCDVSARQALDMLCQALDAQPVSVIGRRCTLYRHNPELEQPIVLP